MVLFGQSGQKTAAQVLAGALATYATSSNLSGTVATSYGFNSSAAGTAAKTINVGTDGAAIGLLNNTSYTVGQLLKQANTVGLSNSTAANALNNIFSNINQTGDIV